VGTPVQMSGTEISKIPATCTTPIPCYQYSACDQGKPTTVPDIWPPSVKAPRLCKDGFCEVCSSCFSTYQGKCPCCNPLNQDQDACLTCRVQNSAACGSPVVSYSCDTDKQGQPFCQANPGSAEKYPTDAACEAVCVQKFKCINNKCAVSAKGESKSSCEAFCG
jgi:hypothetical protein